MGFPAPKSRSRSIERSPGLPGRNGGTLQVRFDSTRSVGPPGIGVSILLDSLPSAEPGASFDDESRPPFPPLTPGRALVFFLAAGASLSPLSPPAGIMSFPAAPLGFLVVREARRGPWQNECVGRHPGSP